ncbi:glycoprotein 3-alpha-L-fucosyltransferase A-like [Ruditapes philippinarum]|uniref:glycoprotein 3-alpha-L-fucosyltransferase A-like n=1 Tax=Ruditapes philippinarum TaxID=129788 RepID=UPI00295BEEB2|nr:glycoprotein 3-alpha-L-fucosyltransferase A-like [Ruditapes philippinarum]
MRVCFYMNRNVNIVLLVVLVLMFLIISREYVGRSIKKILSKAVNNDTLAAPSLASYLSRQKYLVLYYNPSTFVSTNLKYAMPCNFEKCEWNNCELTFDKNDARGSDAVIFDGMYIPKKLNFTRPNGQVWIFAAHESPQMYHIGKNWWYKNNYAFNWTMTYDKDNTDIYFPYGEIRKSKVHVHRYFETVARNKNSTRPLMIASHCTTNAKRQQYVKELNKHINLTILGRCGRLWNCGKRFRHDEFCFRILNRTYLFYLAFENAFCHNYFTEKFFENFNYDTIMITRGGLPGDAKRLFPEGSYISTDDFKTAKDLAMYLRSLTVADIVKLLQRKNQFYSTGYKPVYQRAFCDICYRMNFQKKFEKTIQDMKKWAFDSKPCLHPKEVKDIS